MPREERGGEGGRWREERAEGGGRRGEENGGVRGGEWWSEGRRMVE